MFRNWQIFGLGRTACSLLLVGMALGSFAKAAAPVQRATAAEQTPPAVRQAAHTSAVAQADYCAACETEPHYLHEGVHAAPVLSPLAHRPLMRNMWGGVEYLLWWEREGFLPPLVARSADGTARDDAAVLGEPGTEILLGNEDVNANTLSGGRLMVGRWLDPHDTFGVGGRFFAIENDRIDFTATSTQFPILGRPFFNAFTGEQDALLLGFPGEIQGRINAHVENEVTGAEAFLRQLFRQGCNYQIDLVMGYRFFNLDESLTISNSLEFIDPQSDSLGTTIDQQDLFQIDNEFHGGEIGFMGHSVEGLWSLDFIAKVALGTVTRRARIEGSTITTPAGGPATTLNGGLLTQGTNIGSYQDSDFAVIPELTVTLGRHLTERLELTVGYTFIYINQIARVGSLVDTSVNLTQQTGALNGPARPTFRFTDDDYWLQGINFGLNWRF